MKKEIKVCNRCEKTSESDPTIEQFSFWIDRRADAAGGMENYYKYFDLCSKCKGVLLFMLLSAERYNYNSAYKLSLEQTTRLIELAKFKIPPEEH